MVVDGAGNVVWVMWHVYSVVDGAGNIVWVTWRVHGVVEGGGRCWLRCLSGVAVHFSSAHF